MTVVLKRRNLSEVFGDETYKDKNIIEGSEKEKQKEKEKEKEQQQQQLQENNENGAENLAEGDQQQAKVRY